MVAVLLLGIATVGTAWCGYQSSQWNGAQTDLARTSSDQRVEASRLFGLATQKVSYDATSVAQYAQAVQTGNVKLAQFYRKNLVRPPFLPLLDKWQAEIAAGGSPAVLFQNPAYLNAQFGPTRTPSTVGAFDGGQPEGRRDSQQIRRHHHPAGDRAVLRRSDVVVRIQAGASLPDHAVHRHRWHLSHTAGRIARQLTVSGPISAAATTGRE